MKLDNKFIIIVPVYNAKDLIVECLSSIISQDFDDLGVIIRDDISTDGTNTIINDFFWYEW
jgi:glycosyltransferase involved in cell wall biosynthesis